MSEEIYTPKIQSDIVPYSCLPAVIKSIDQQVHTVYSSLKSYILAFSGQITQLVAGVDELHRSLQLKIKDMELKIKACEDKPLHTDIGKKFIHSTCTKMTISPTFSATAQLVKKDTVTQIDNLLEKYHTQCSKISHQMRELIHSWIDNEAEYDSLYRQYELAAKTYIEAKEKGKKLKTPKEQYERAHKAALQSHEEFQTKTARICLQLEQALTSFENLEEWRASMIREIMSTFAEHVFSIATEFVMAKSDLNSEVRSVDPFKEPNLIRDFSFIRPIEADDAFQPFPFPRQITTIMPKEQLFPDSEGKHFCKAKKEYAHPPPTHLPLCEGEVLILIEEDGEFSKCQNVNGSIGFAPTKLLQHM